MSQDLLGGAVPARVGIERATTLRRWWGLLAARNPFALLVGGTTFLSATLGIVVAWRALLGLPDAAWEVVLATFPAVVTVCALALVARVQVRHGRHARYAHATVAFHNACHALRDAFASVQRGDDPDVYIRRVDEALTSLAQAFSTVTGAPCRVCIKQLFGTGAEGTVDPSDEEGLRRLKVSTWARDTSSRSRISSSREDYVSDNTDYKRLILDRYLDRCFLSNDLERENPYENSHWVEGMPREYRATIVWPIQYRLRQATPRLDLQGFLCVDTQSVGAFRRHFDFDLGAAFADSLYPLMATVTRLEQGEVDVRAAPEEEALA